MQNFPIEIISESPDDTFNAGKNITDLLTAGSVIALSGRLGSGKTCFANGVASGLGIKEILLSPTYTIINEYDIPRDTPTAIQGSVPVVHDSMNNMPKILYHIDAYRLNNEKEFEDIGGLEIINSDGIVIIEWSENIKKILNKNCLTVTIKIQNNNSRIIEIVQGI